MDGAKDEKCNKEQTVYLTLVREENGRERGQKETSILGGLAHFQYLMSRLLIHQNEINKKSLRNHLPVTIPLIKKNQQLCFDILPSLALKSK